MPGMTLAGKVVNGYLSPTLLHNLGSLEIEPSEVKTEVCPGLWSLADCLPPSDAIS